MRREDIPFLTSVFIKRIAIESGKEVTGMDKAALDILVGHPWPGNVRQLINTIEYAFVLCRQGHIRPDHLPPEIVGESDLPACDPAAPGPARGPGPPGKNSGGPAPDRREKGGRGLDPGRQPGDLVEMVEAIRHPGGKRRPASPSPERPGGGMDYKGPIWPATV